MDDKANANRYPASGQGDAIEITEDALWTGWEVLRFSGSGALSLEAYKEAVLATLSALRIHCRIVCCFA